MSNLKSLLAAEPSNSLARRALTEIERLENQTKENPLVQNRIGVIRFSGEILRDINNEIRVKLFGELIPMGMIYDPIYASYSLQAASWHFRVVDPDYDKTPEYNVIVTKNLDMSYDVKFIEKTRDY
jgi:hypothetical protein